ncbi:7961_t:CDS:2 [Racocetra fulgida]|uniref:7961_t:CDS:1 n=1 Tax=Racocetra fulgida TaxID=60492 RepID=A0A9N8VVN7_9GLOM|nr:7961_t:CDS:2 [Racocetra fulgida]
MIENKALNLESLKTIVIIVVTKKKKVTTVRIILTTLTEIKEIELDYCEHCGSTDHVRKEECTEIKLLKEQQARKCKCDQIKVQVAIQQDFETSKRKRMS